MTKFSTIFLLSIVFSISMANAKILKTKEEFKNCRTNFEKMSDKDKIDCLQTAVLNNSQRVADLELVTENLRR